MQQSVSTLAGAAGAGPGAAKLYALYLTAVVRASAFALPSSPTALHLCRELHMVMVFLGLLVNTGEVAATLALDILQAPAPSRMPACGLVCSLRP